MVNLEKKCSLRNIKKYKCSVNFWVSLIGFFKTGCLGWFATGAGLVIFSSIIDSSQFIMGFVFFGGFVSGGLVISILMCRATINTLDMCLKYKKTKELEIENHF